MECSWIVVQWFEVVAVVHIQLVVESEPMVLRSCSLAEAVVDWNFP